MFKFLKEKLGKWFKKAEKEIEKKEIEIKPQAKIYTLEEAKKLIGLKEKLKVEEKVSKIIEEKPIKKEEMPPKVIKEPEIKPQIKIEEEIKPELKIEKPAKSLRRFFGIKIGIVKINQETFDSIWQDLEIILLENNVAFEVVEKIKKNMREKIVGKEINKKQVADYIKEILKYTLSDVLLPPFDLIEKIKQFEKEKKERPFVILFCGINGSGKTTTIAKIAYLLQKHNISCVFAASDTFRAASIEQLIKHAEKLGVRVIKQHYGSDPAAVAFDAIEHAKAHNIKAVLIDTAGRMHTKENLMKEMQKIVKVSKPDLKIFVGEIITGNDATIQASNFNKAIDIDGIILSKADVDEKGGTAISVSHVTGKPILYLGTGQKLEDLEKFQEEKIVKSLGL